VRDGVEVRRDGGGAMGATTARRVLWMRGCRGARFGWGDGGEREAMRGRGAWVGECEAAPGEGTFT
jgi:hypothetical protein